MHHAPINKKLVHLITDTPLTNMNVLNVIKYEYPCRTRVPRPPVLVPLGGS